MPIQFIDNTSIDRRTRKLIRSHVAKGKNVGRIIHRPSRYSRQRKVEIKATTPSSVPGHEVEALSYDRNNSKSTISIQRQFQEDLSASLPFHVSPMCRRLFYQLVTFINVLPYPPELRRIVTVVNGPRLFLQYAFIDEAFFHCVVAMSVAASASLAVTHQETTEALRHLSRTLRLVNQRLAKDKDIALSDTTLAVVIAMTQHERLLGYQRHALVHFEGLQRIIELRGGISKLVTECPAIAQKAFRADFDFALQYGSPTRFSVEYVPGESTLGCLREKYRHAQAASADRHSCITHVSEGLQKALEDISTLAWLVNDYDAHQIQIEDYDFHNVLLLVGYRILNVRPLNTPLEVTDKLELLLQLGLTALMTKFFVTLGLKQPDARLLNSCIFSAAQLECYDSKEAQELLLWLLCTGNASMSKALNEEIWLIPKISEVTRRLELDLRSWEDVLEILQKFPWVSVFQDEAAQALWNQVSSSYRPL
ncbi:hypothetical protein F5Y19DRAFT_377458 [Xylariaceae sp. FL1651]|nr:hypothetical protein F5Y19DRAFT_377458 [Xylariaceae sp. FL1651]